MKNRIIWVDYIKTITIFLVILAHTPLETGVQNFIYTFHMPVFFFISGYLFSFEKYTSFTIFFKRRFQQLMIPYFIFSLINFFFWFFIGKKFGADSQLEIPFYYPILGIIYGNGIQPWMIHCIPLWFFPCIFLVEIIYYFLFKNLNNKFIGILALIFINYLFIKINPFRLPWSLNTSIVALSLYGIGNLSKKHITQLQEQNLYIKIVLYSIGMLIIYYIAQINGRINMHVHYYGNYILFLTGAFTGIISLVLISDVLGTIFKRQQWIEYISNNTFIIVGFHLMIGSLIKGMCVFLLNLPLTTFENAIWPNLIFSLLSLILLIPTIYILNEYFPFLLGSKRSAIPFGDSISKEPTV